MSPARRWALVLQELIELDLTNGFEGCHTKIKLLKRLRYGYRKVQI